MAKKGKNGKKNKELQDAKKDKTWNIVDTTNHSCPYAEIIIKIPSNLYDEIMKVYLYGLRHGIEISIYARIVDRCITEIYVPVQTNGGADVGLQETVPLTWNCLIHSHPSSVKHFSQQDWLTLMVNRDYCLLINDGKFTDGKARLNMPCGCTLYSDIMVALPENELKEKIKKREEVVVEGGYSQWGEGWNQEMAEEYYKQMYSM